jgi:predicted nucleic acid-binding protein
MIVVVDASVAAMWFLPEPRSELAASLLDAPCEIVAPDLLHIEVANAFLKAARRGAIDSTDAAAALARLAAPSVRFEHSGSYAETAFELAERHGGSVYDGVYIALAKALSATIATNDTELAQTARSAAVPVWHLADPPPPALRA